MIVDQDSSIAHTVKQYYASLCMLHQGQAVPVSVSR